MTSFLFLLSIAVLPWPHKLVVTGGETTTGEVACVTCKAIPQEGYRLSVRADGITIESSSAAGEFYARQTLAQLVNGVKCPCVEIDDAPAYGWRGVHIDECRHFFGKRTLKRVLDIMAEYKLNVFHWHLTDDQGWRLDVPGYPDLVRYGAVRPASPVHGALWQKRSDGTKFLELDGQTYGPFYYTESDVREIVGYATERHIMVVPEIELPGHVFAALAAYPEFACRPVNLAKRCPRLEWGLERDVLCVGNDRALAFMENVLDYVCRVFPGRCVHIGGDECPTDRWEDCPKCQARIAAEGLKDVNGLQPWVTRRFVRFLESRGKRAVGWDECLNGNVPASTIGMSWRTMGAAGVGHDGVKLMSGAEAVLKGHDMVVTPLGFTYFCYDQGIKDDPFQYGWTERSFGGVGRLPLKKVYEFDPCADIPESARTHVLGGQCCNWSEYTWNECDLEWKMWPRTCAIAEVLWLGNEKPGFDDFLCRMRAHRIRLIGKGVNCALLDELK